MINKKVYFIQEQCGFDELIKQSLEFSAYLKKQNIKEISIFLTSTFDFCVALFGAMNSGVVAHILVDNNSAQINDENFSKCKVKNVQDNNIKFNLQWQFYLYTSGSSGTSKAILKTLEEMFNEAKFLCKFLNKNNFNAINIYTSISHQHMFGMTFKVFLPLVAGFNILSERLEALEILATYDFTNTIFITSPVILQSIKRSNLSMLNNVSLIVTAGSKFDDTLRQYFNSKILEIYGSTETGVIAANFGDGFEIFDEVNAQVKQEQRLLISSPWCSNFLSSDLVEISNNKLKLLGRFDRIVKLNDIRFNLDEAEKILKENSLIYDAKCALLSGEKRIKALIILNEDGQKEFIKNGKKAITDYLKEYLYPYFKTNIRFFKIISQIPKNANGKFSVKDFGKYYDMKIKPEFNLIDTKDDEYIFESLINIDCFFFEGHFRDFPITPGFIQLGFVFDCLEQLDLKITQNYILENLKFTTFLRPLNICKIYIEIKQKIIHFRIFANENICASGRIKIV